MHAALTEGCADLTADLRPEAQEPTQVLAPIDYRHRPWRTKRLIETPVLDFWTIFGARSDGSVDISNAQRDIFQWVPRGVAEDIVAARNAFVDVVVKHLGVTEGAATPATRRVLPRGPRAPAAFPVAWRGYSVEADRIAWELCV